MLQRLAERVNFLTSASYCCTGSCLGLAPCARIYLMHVFSDMKHALCSPAPSRYATWALAPPSSGPVHICAERCSVIASARSSILMCHDPMEALLQPSSDTTGTSRIILRALTQIDGRHASADAIGRPSAAKSPQVPFFDGCIASQGLQLRRPPLAHRPPVWPRWVWRFGRVEWAAQCVFQQQVLRGGQSDRGRPDIVNLSPVSAIASCM